MDSIKYYQSLRYSSVSNDLIRFRKEQFLYVCIFLFLYLCLSLYLSLCL